MDSWVIPTIAVLSVGTVLYVFGVGFKKRRPTQHDLDPTLKKNQVRITTTKKAFRRDELPPEYLAQLARKDIVEIPMGAPRPPLPTSSEQETTSTTTSNEWLPDHLKTNGKRKTKKT